MFQIKAARPLSNTSSLPPLKSPYFLITSSCTEAMQNHINNLNPHNFMDPSHFVPRQWLTHWGRDKGPQFHRRHFNCISLNENMWISIKISLIFVPKSPINNDPALCQAMAWRRPSDKPLSEHQMAEVTDAYIYVYASLGLRHFGNQFDENNNICVGEPGHLGSCNGLSPVRRQAITWTNAD